jgi:hypothetical protein
VLSFPHHRCLQEVQSVHNDDGASTGPRLRLTWVLLQAASLLSRLGARGAPDRWRALTAATSHPGAREEEEAEEWQDRDCVQGGKYVTAPTMTQQTGVQPCKESITWKHYLLSIQTIPSPGGQTGLSQDTHVLAHVPTRLCL